MPPTTAAAKARELLYNAAKSLGSANPLEDVGDVLDQSLAFPLGESYHRDRGGPLAPSFSETAPENLSFVIGADGRHVTPADRIESATQAMENIVSHRFGREARRRLGAKAILGGTVNHHADVVRARAAGCLDYAGVGPLRFTQTKQKLAPVLGLAGVGELIAALGELPAWVIGGVEPADLPALRAAGAAGAAVSSALFRDGLTAENFRAFPAAWAAQPVSLS